MKTKAAVEMHRLGLGNSRSGILVFYQLWIPVISSIMLSSNSLSFSNKQNILNEKM